MVNYILTDVNVFRSFQQAWKASQRNEGIERHKNLPEGQRWPLYYLSVKRAGIRQEP